PMNLPFPHTEWEPADPLIQKVPMNPTRTFHPSFPTIVLGLLLAFASLSVSPRASAQTPDPATPPERMKVLFLGDQRNHQPVERMRDAAPAMLDRGIELVYTEDLNDLNLETLRRYD